MFGPERRQRIVQHLRRHGTVTLHDLARLTESSEVTVRRDLRALEAEGLLSRRRGGAVLGRGADEEIPSARKAHVAQAEKAAIAERACELVAPGDAIAIGAGTTTHAFAERLAGVRELTVVTNSLLVAQALSRAEAVEVIVTGGSLRGSIHALVGSAAERSLAGLHTARAFLSGNGVTAARGVSTPSLSVAGVDRALAATAADVVVLADHTKVGVDTMWQTVAPERVHHLLTDARADPGELAALAAAGVDVQVAEPAPQAVRSA
jgi:DeoR/GlpR family transcriptional regulator of sugar metabolism